MDSLLIFGLLALAATLAGVVPLITQFVRGIDEASSLGGARVFLGEDGLPGVKLFVDHEIGVADVRNAEMDFLAQLYLAYYLDRNGGRVLSWREESVGERATYHFLVREDDGSEKRMVMALGKGGGVN